MGKNASKNKIYQQKQIIDTAAMEDSDRKLLHIVREYLSDILDNTYNALINEIFMQITKDSGTVHSEEFDKYYFFKLSAFIIQLQRLKAHDEHQKK